MFSPRKHSWRQEGPIKNLLHILFLETEDRESSNPLIWAEQRRIVYDVIASGLEVKLMMIRGYCTSYKCDVSEKRVYCTSYKCDASGTTPYCYMCTITNATTHSLLNKTPLKGLHYTRSRTATLKYATNNTSPNLTTLKPIKIGPPIIKLPQSFKSASVHETQ